MNKEMYKDIKSGAEIQMYEESSSSSQSDFGDLEKVEDTSISKVPDKKGELTDTTNGIKSTSASNMRSSSFDQKTLDNKLKAFEQKLKEGQRLDEPEIYANRLLGIKVNTTDRIVMRNYNGIVTKNVR